MTQDKDKTAPTQKPATLPLLLGLAALAVLLLAAVWGTRDNSQTTPSATTGETTTASAPSTTTTGGTTNATGAEQAATTAPAAPPTPTVPVADLHAAGTLPDNVLGSASAPVTIVEYASMTCPHCARFHADVLPEVKKKYIDTGKAKLVFREFPLDNLAVAVSMLARCAGPMRYFAFIDGMYKKQDDWTDFPAADGPLPKLKAMTKEAGFTDESVDKCLSDQKLLDGLNEISSRAKEKFGVNATPTIFVNGVKLENGNGIEEFDKIMKAFGQG